MSYYLFGIEIAIKLKKREDLSGPKWPSIYFSFSAVCVAIKRPEPQNEQQKQQQQKKHESINYNNIFHGSQLGANSIET